MRSRSCQDSQTVAVTAITNSGSEKKMTRKDFQAVADILASHREHVSENEFAKLANEFAIFCKTQNRSFNKEKFLDAVYA
jgi:hypothetical protein